MATFDQIFEILSLSNPNAKTLFERIGVGTLVTASKILLGLDTSAPFDQTQGAHDKRIIWAVTVAKKPRGADQDVFGAIVAANTNATQTQILNATDEAIQVEIDKVADAFAQELDTRLATRAV